MHIWILDNRFLPIYMDLMSCVMNAGIPEFRIASVKAFMNDEESFEDSR